MPQLISSTWGRFCHNPLSVEFPCSVLFRSRGVAKHRVPGTMASLPPTEGRVPLHSPKGVNKRIQDAAIRRVHRQAGASASELSNAIRRLEREWDMERTLELNASIAAGLGLVLIASGYPSWVWWSAGVLAFLAQHSVQGWCPPMPVMRWFGVRTAEEIQDEITALRVLRGDFAFASSDTAHEQLVERMVRNKESSGAFVGESAAAKAGGQPVPSTATAKEE